MIPKIIHQFYRDDSVSLKRMRTIKNSNKDWIYKTWTFDSIKKLYVHLPPGYEDFSFKFENFIKNEMWETAEEIARFLILYSEGGIFIDSGYELVSGKKLKNIPFKDNDLVLFNGIIRTKNVWRIQNNIMACKKNHRFMLHLMAYIGQKDFMPISPWDGKILEVYGQTYLTTQYIVYMSLWNGTRPPDKCISILKDVNKIKLIDKEVVLDPFFTFVTNKSMVLKHNAVAQQIIR